MARQVSRGTCALCGAQYSKPGMTRHLETCQQRDRAEGKTEESQTTQKTSVFHVLIEGRSLPMYWLHLAITSETTLATLDQFLRDIWLECCGHLSAFEIGGLRYTVDASIYEDEWWGRRHKHMRFRLDEVFYVGQTYSYEYDFGSTTELTIKVISQREVMTQNEPIRVLARNNPPSPVFCDSCGNPATCMCSQCIYEDGGYLCAECAKEHACGEEMLLPRVNSPREGVCGYTGQKRAYR